MLVKLVKVKPEVLAVVDFISKVLVGAVWLMPIFPAGAATVPVKPVPKIELPIFNWLLPATVADCVLLPINILLSPLVTTLPALWPNATLSIPEVKLASVFLPTAVLPFPVVLLKSAAWPIAVYR